MRGEHLGEFEELLLLAVRMVGEEAHSVAIQNSLREHADREVSLGAIYAGLDRLERKGLVESWLGEPAARRGGRAKRHYRLTDRGVEALNETRVIRDRLWTMGKESV